MANGNKKVLISSTLLDLPVHREEVREACVRQGMFPLMAEEAGAGDSDQIKQALSMVDEADIYLGIFAHRYGYVPEGHDISIVEMEYNRAVERGIPRLIFLMHEDHPIKASDVEIGAGASKLQAFKQRLMTDRVVRFFKSPEELRAHVIDSLSEYRLRDATALHYISDIPNPPESYIAHPYTLLQTRGFIGRHAELNLLTDWVSRAKEDVYQARIFSLVAIGGMGKSALAWKWFNDIAPLEMRPLAGRVWWSFESNPHFDNFIVRALAYVTGQPKEEIQKLPLPECETQLLAVLNREPFLLVLDGFERSLIAYARMDSALPANDAFDRKTSRRIRANLNSNFTDEAGASLASRHRLRRSSDPHAGAFLRKLTGIRSSRILITTRLYPAELQTLTGDLVPGSFAFSLRGLSDSDALELWRASGVIGSSQSLLPMFQVFENHPLMIQTLASEVANDRRAPGDFDRWRQEHPDFDPFKLPLKQAEAHVLNFALRGLDEKASRVLMTIAAFRMPATYDTLSALLVGEGKILVDETSLVNALTELEDRGLLGWDRRANRYDLHPIVRGMVWSSLEAKDKEETYKTLQEHFEALPAVDSRQVNSLEDLAPQIELYNVLVGLGRYDDAVQLFRKHLFYEMHYRLSTNRQIAELLELLFPNGLDQLPSLSSPSTQAYVLATLAAAYNLCGQPERAIPLYRRHNILQEALKDQTRLGLGISFLAEPLRQTGSLRDSEASARRALLIARAQQDLFNEAFSLRTLGLAFAARGLAEPSEIALLRALRMSKDTASLEILVNADLAQRALWIGDLKAAQDLVMQASHLALTHQYQRYIVRTSRLQGTVALSLADLIAADERLSFALVGARVINLVQEELHALIGLAELRRRQGDLKAARELLDDVWELAERGPYPLLQADACNVLAQIERDSGKQAAAAAAAVKAYRLAWCDGPPFVYHWGLDAARAHLSSIGIPEPDDLPPYQDYDYEALAEVELNPPDYYSGQAPKESSSTKVPEKKKPGVEVSPPVYLLSLVVENVRSFGEAQPLDLSDGKGRPAPWTVILGDNGVGKTTLLQCIAALDPTLDPFYLREQRLFVRQTEDYEPQLEQQHMPKKGRPSSEIKGTIFYGARLKEGKKGETETYTFIKSQGLREKSEVTKLVELPALICYGYGASRRMGETALTNQAVKENSASLFSDEAALMNAEEWLVQLDYAANKPSSVQKKAKNNLTEVKGLLRNLLPDMTEIRIDPPDSNRPQPSVKFKTPYGWVPIQSLSVGYRTMIAWMVDLARRMYERYPDKLRPLAEPAIVLIDEIDLHLHPQWQRNLMGYLGKYFKNTQFIVTAHSPLVVQAAANANLILLKKKEKQNYVEIINEVTKIRGWRVDQVLTSDLFGLTSARPPELDELLEQRKKILEKPTLTEDDEKDLAQLQTQIGELSGGETQEDIEAIDIIHRAAKVLKELEQTMK